MISSIREKDSIVRETENSDFHGNINLAHLFYKKNILVNQGLVKENFGTFSSY